MNDIFSVALRGAPMLIKLLLLFQLGFYSLDFVGDYGVKIGLLTILTTLFGLESYNLTSKYFVSDKSQFYRTYSSYIWISTLVFGISVFALLIGCLFLSLNFGGYFVLFAIAFLDFLLAEYYRITIVSKSTFYVNLVFFLKNGIWPLVFLCVAIVSESLEIAFSSYLITQATILLVVGSIHLKIFKRLKRPSLRNVDFSLIIYSCRAVVLRMNQYMDRFLTSFYLGDQATGVLVLMTTLANFIGQIGEAIVVPKYFKDILNAPKKTLIRQYKLDLKKTAMICSFIPLLAFCVYANLKGLELKSYAFGMLLIVITSIVNLVGLPFHHGLLAFQRHFSILKIAVLQFSISILVLNICLYSFNHLTPLFLSILFISVLMFFVKKNVFEKEYIAQI